MMSVPQKSVTAKILIPEQLQLLGRRGGGGVQHGAKHV
jgi:hypothetical protein